jgi:drug/metabolite transporter (DMT)-like permease
VTYFLAICSAFCAASGAAVQDREVSRFDEAQAKGLRLLLSSLGKPWWWVGLIVMVGSPVFQYFALRVGNLTQVQPMLTTELLFLLGLVVMTHHQRPGVREFGGATLVVGGLVIFLASAHPRGGASPLSWHWGLVLTFVFSAFVLGFVLGALRLQPGGAKAAVLGSAAAICFTYQAAMTDSVAKNHHLVSILCSPALYLLMLRGLVGFVLFQKAMRAGHVAASRAAMVTVDPLLSVGVGIAVFGEHVALSPLAIVFELLGLLVLLSGARVLASSRLIAQISVE